MGERAQRRVAGNARQVCGSGPSVLSVAKNFIGHLNESAGREPTQFVAQQFSGRCLRQFVRKFDMSRVLVWRDSMFDELLQFAREFRSSCDAFPNHDEGFGSAEFRIFSISDDRRFQDTFVLN